MAQGAALANLGTQSITATQLASDAVETAKIKNVSVTAGKLAENAVETAKIKDAAVETAKIKDANVTQAKIAANVATTGPVFSARCDNYQTIANGAFREIVFNTEEVDTASAYSVSTGRFTPQIAGYYHFTTMVDVTTTSSPSHAEVAIFKNGATAYPGSATFVDVNKNARIVASAVIYLNGTTDYVSTFTSTTIYDGQLGQNTFFQGYLARAA